MLSGKEQELNEILLAVATELDIAPSKYKQAMDRSKSVGKQLKEGCYPSIDTEPDVYMQGSFRLGTVIRPLKDGKDADYDVDLVCQMPTQKDNVSPEELKNMVGDCLKSNGNYSSMVDEGKRCWTLEYSEQDGIGFHMDILPSIPTDDSARQRLINRNVPDTYYEHAIDLTEKDKERKSYSWKEGGSNPEGYALWFDNKKGNYPEYRNFSFSQKTKISKTVVDQQDMRIFASIDDVPEQLVRTPLQRTIQILKHHRDRHFKDNPDNKPISIIITTLVTRFYAGESDLYSTLTNAIRNINDYAQYLDQNIKYSANVAELRNITAYWEGYVPEIDKPIFKLRGKWYIPNPVNPAENFADRWDDNKANAFFQWLGKLTQDFRLILQQQGYSEISKILVPMFGDKIVRNAFVKIGERTRADIDSNAVRTSPNSGNLSKHGTVKNPKHNFYS